MTPFVRVLPEAELTEIEDPNSEETELSDEAYLLLHETFLEGTSEARFKEVLLERRTNAGSTLRLVF